MVELNAGVFKEICTGLFLELKGKLFRKIESRDLLLSSYFKIKSMRRRCHMKAKQKPRRRQIQV